MPAVGALVFLDNARVVPTLGLFSRRPIDLLTGGALSGLPRDRSEPETLSPSRMVVNPEVAPVNGERERLVPDLSGLLTSRSTPG